MDLINVDSDEEQENNPWEQAYSGKNGYIFLIDARKAMFCGAEKSYFSHSFEVYFLNNLYLPCQFNFSIFNFWYLKFTFG